MIELIVILLIVAVLAYLAYTYLPKPFNWIGAGIIILIGAVKLLA